jgi:hypothetical protein
LPPSVCSALCVGSMFMFKSMRVAGEGGHPGVPSLLAGKP